MENLVVDKKIEQIEWDLKDSTKGKFKHYMLKEISEQPDSVKRAFGEGGRLMPDFGTTKLGGLNIEKQEYFDIEKISIFGMGTAFYAGMTGAYLLEHLTRIPTTIDQASELRYRNPIVQKNTLYLAVSQSGETIDTLSAMREIQNRGGKVLGICNTVGSTIARESDGGVYIHAGPEIAVASTKAFTSQLTVFLMIALMIGRMRDIPISKGKAILKELESIPEAIKLVLDNPSQIQKLAKKYKTYQHFLFLGRGINYPIALEGALKLKEVSYIHAEGFSAGDIKHGPIALVNKDVPTLFIVVKGETFEKIIGNIEEIKARNGKVIVITNSSDQRLKKLADDLILIPETSETFSPLLTIIPLQLFTYYLAKELKRDIDQPRNLAKTVTVE
jgi:glutamine---fructose-6-phosphate transaminase (isomerizing)